jgi:hypothetical protein
MRLLICFVCLSVAALTACTDAPSAPLVKGPDSQRSCSAQIGALASKRLVQQCVQVSPATHPPCNAQNSCDMIRDEIKRGCDFIGEGKPSFCGS